MKKSLGIDSPDSYSFLCNNSCKWGNEQIDPKSNNILRTNKKGKKLLGGEQIVIEMNCWIL